MQKNKRGKKEPVIREIKSYVYSVTPHILWSGAKCGVLEGKQIACPSTGLCLFLLLSLELHEQMWALKMNVQLKKLLLHDLFLLWRIAGILCLIFRKYSSLLQGHVRSQDLSCSQVVLFPAAIFSTLGGHFTFSSAFFFHSHCFKHCNTAMMSSGFYLSQTGPWCGFVSNRNTPISPTLAYTHALSSWETNTFVSYCICETKSLPPPDPTLIFTVDSQVLGQPCWLELTSVLPFDTHHKWKTRQTRFPHKGLEGSSSASEAACSSGFTRVHTYAHRRPVGSDKKKPF